LHRGFVEAMKDPVVTGKLSDLALDIVTGSPADFGALIREDTRRLGAVVKEAGVKAE
jgi:tripartite-type tricarboxylate transporter receptor subunit TctC